MDLLIIRIVFTLFILTTFVSTSSIRILNDILTLQQNDPPIGISYDDLIMLNESRVTDQPIFAADERLPTEWDLIPFIDCVAESTGLPSPTLDDVLRRLERYTLREFIDEMFRCLKSLRFPQNKLEQLDDSNSKLIIPIGFGKPTTPKPSQPGSKVERPDLVPPSEKVRPDKIEQPDKGFGRPNKVEKPDENRPNKEEKIPIEPVHPGRPVRPGGKPNKERGDGRIEIFFARLRWTLWQYLKQLKKQGDHSLYYNPSIIFVSDSGLWNRRRRYSPKFPSSADCELFDPRCSYYFEPADLLDDTDSLGDVVVDGIEDVAKTIGRFSIGLRHVNHNFRRFVNSGLDLILG